MVTCTVCAGKNDKRGKNANQGRQFNVTPTSIILELSECGMHIGFGSQYKQNDEYDHETHCLEDKQRTFYPGKTFHEAVSQNSGG